MDDIKVKRVNNLSKEERRALRTPSGWIRRARKIIHTAMFHVKDLDECDVEICVSGQIAYNKLGEMHGEAKTYNSSKAT